MKIGKSIIAIILSSFTGLVLNPEVLTALDMQKFSDIDTSRVAQTVLLPVVLPEIAGSTVPVTSSYTELVATPVVTEVRETATAMSAAAPTSVNAVQTTAALRNNTILINGRAINLESTDRLDKDAETETKAWYYTGGKLIYGHNLSYVFGGLKNLKNGDTFTVNYSGEMHTFEVKDIKIYDYDGQILTLDGGGNYMQYVKLGKSSKSVPYDMALMTCHGANDSQRIVIFANEM